MPAVFKQVLLNIPSLMQSLIMFFEHALTSTDRRLAIINASHPPGILLVISLFIDQYK